MASQQYNTDMIITQTLQLTTQGQGEMIDVTPQVTDLIDRSPVRQGQVLIFVPGSTGALSTIEYEPGLKKDWPALMEKLIPQKEHYHHNETWHDGNGHSHLRATMIGPSLTIPIADHKPILGTWQQIIFLEFDNKPHHRRLVVQISGE
jgi:secondary thiamine-phosphate synthase enzyme